MPDARGGCTLDWRAFRGAALCDLLAICLRADVFRFSTFVQHLNDETLRPEDMREACAAMHAHTQC